MKYICLVYHEEQKLLSTPDQELAAIVKQGGDWIGDLERSNQHVFSAGLQSIRSGATLRRRNGELSITDGPFAETKEFLGGFTIIEARDFNEAISIASKFSSADLGSVEVRPLFCPDQEMIDPLDRKIAKAILDSAQE